MEVSAQQRHELQQVLLSKFSGRDDLAYLLEKYLHLNLDEVVSSANYEGVVSQLIDFLDHRGQIGDLVYALDTTNLNDPQIQALQRSLFPPTLKKSTLRRTPRTAQGYIEPLLAVGDALPLHMVLVPGGTFLMGSSDDELDREESERPQHEVTVPPFFMGRYPITQNQWQSVTALPPINRRLESDPSEFKGNNQPVERVSWYDAIEFCDRLARYTKRAYRLPSEAEWEYACRANTTTPFSFGRTLTSEIANYNGNYSYDNGPRGESRDKTTPVDFFGIANSFGLSDMHGNVYEWCQDEWHENYQDASTHGNSRTKSTNSSARVARGGSWFTMPKTCRSAFRLDFVPDYFDSFIGFRVCCSTPKSQDL